MNSESFKLRNFWEWDKVEREFERLQSGESQSIFVGTDIWRCISVELWMRIFIDGQDFATSREQCIPKKLVPVQMA